MITSTNTKGIYREYFVSKYVNNFQTNEPVATTLLLTLHMYFRAFNFRISQAVQNYFNNKIFAIYGILFLHTYNKVILLYYEQKVLNGGPFSYNIIILLDSLVVHMTPASSLWPQL